MMKTLITTLLLLIIPLFNFAQGSERVLMQVNLNDKGGDKSQLAGSIPSLSSKAIERREKFNINIDVSDLPLCKTYLENLSGMGAKIVAKSRWFNYVVIESDPVISEKVLHLPFVSSAIKLNTQNKQEASIFEIKEFFRNESLVPFAASSLKSTESNYYNYGAAANQINMIKGEFLHDNGYRGQGMTIAVLDAGFNSADVMPAFDSLWNSDRILGIHNFVNNGNIFDPGISSHGTSVLSTMGANIPGEMVGTAPEAKYWLLRTEDATAEYILEEYYWVEAAEFADSVGADVINSSLGYTTFDDPSANHTYEDMNGNTTIVTKGADKAAEKGILVVNSAGNSGTNSWHYIGAPADGDSVFTIGAVDASGFYASFSSMGPTYDGRIKPDVSAKGQGTAVYSPWGLNYGSGTSFSSPIIAGMSTCLWQAAPELNNMQIQQAIKSTASRSGNPNDSIGWGIPDYSAAFNVLSTARQQHPPVRNSLNIYPNPFSSFCTIEFNHSPAANQLTFVIYDFTGQKIRNFDLAIRPGDLKVRLDLLADLVPGCYYMNVLSKYGNYSKSFVKF